MGIFRTKPQEIMERKLAHIEIIDELRPIPGADKIEVAVVLGWECVVKKGEFKSGDKIIYVEVDSIMPEKPEYEFLRERKFRVRTIKLRGQISQGLVLPLPKMLEGFGVGTDMTEVLSIAKYLSPSEQNEFDKHEERIKLEKNKFKKFMMRYSWFRNLILPKTKKDGFPYWVSKTDEERIQNIPYVLETFKDRKISITEKIDYQSVTFTGTMVPMFKGWLGNIFPKKSKFNFIVCSRNMINHDENSLYWKIAKKYNIEEILRANPTLTIQGEQGNTNVQSNKYGLTEPHFWVFNIIDHNKNIHYDEIKMRRFCVLHGLPTVPLLSICYLKELGNTVQDLVEYSKGKSLLANIPREGVVIRCIEDGKKLLSFKVINPDFLLKYD